MSNTNNELMKNISKLFLLLFAGAETDIRAAAEVLREVVQLVLGLLSPEVR